MYKSLQKEDVRVWTSQIPDRSSETSIFVHSLGGKISLHEENTKQTLLKGSERSVFVVRISWVISTCVKPISHIVLC